jgi:hypothetical protein
MEMELTHQSRHRLFDCIKKQDSIIYCVQEIHHITKDTHKLRVKGSKKIYQTYTKISQKRQRRSLPSNKGKNLARRRNSTKYIFTEHWCPQVHKTNTSELKKRDRPRYNNSGRSKPPLSSTDRTLRQKINKIS